MPGEKNYSRNVMQDAQLAEFEKELERKDMSLEDYMKQVRAHGPLCTRGQHSRPICTLCPGHSALARGMLPQRQRGEVC